MLNIGPSKKFSWIFCKNLASFFQASSTHHPHFFQLSPHSHAAIQLKVSASFLLAGSKEKLQHGRQQGLLIQATSAKWSFGRMKRKEREMSIYFSFSLHAQKFQSVNVLAVGRLIFNCEKC